MNKPFGSMSPSDPTKKPLTFETQEQADAHTNRMNILLSEYPIGWNVSFWKDKPEKWTTIKPNIKLI